MTSVIFLLVGLLITAGLGYAVFRKAKGSSTQQAQTTTPGTGAQPAQPTQQRRQFPTWAKVLLTVIGAIAVLTVVVIAGLAMNLWLSGPSSQSTQAGTEQQVIRLAAKEMAFPVTAVKDRWSNRYIFPNDMIVDWKVLDPSQARYKIKMQCGEFEFTPEKSDDYKAKCKVIAEVSVMALTDKPEEIWITLYKKGRTPANAIPLNTTPVEPTAPTLPVPSTPVAPPSTAPPDNTTPKEPIEAFPVPPPPPVMPQYPKPKIFKTRSFGNTQSAHDQKVAGTFPFLLSLLESWIRRSGNAECAENESD